MAATSSTSIPGLRLCDKGCGRPAFKSFPSCCNASKFLKDLHALGQANSMSAGTYANVSLENTGTDLSIDHEGFELRLTDKHKAKVGTASKGASRYADESE